MSFIAVGFPVDAGSSVRRRLERVTAGIFAALAARLATDVH